MSGALLYAYPEEVAARGPVAFAVQVEELDAAGVALALTYHPARRWMPRLGGVHHAPPAACWFEPGDGYPDGLRPARTGTLETARAIHTLRVELRRRGLAFHAWLVVLHREPLATARPDLAATTLDGAPTNVALCPANPEVRAHAAALVDDVCRQLEPDGVELEAALPADWRSSYVVSLELAPPTGLRRALHGCCVCDACRADLAAAGADPERTIVSARQAAAGERDAPDAPDALLASRRRTAAAALRAVGDAAGRGGARSRALLFGEPLDLRWQGAEPATLAAADAVAFGTGTASGAALDALLGSVAPLAGTTPLAASMNWSPERTPGAFAADVARAARAGADEVLLYNLSLVPAEGLPALRAAARAARSQQRSPA
jgi:hypothetical protein